MGKSKKTTVSDKDMDSQWSIKYAPQCIDDLILCDDVHEIVKTYIEQKSIPHLLLVGRAGQGKTTLSKILCKDISPDDYLLINASADNGIDTIRGKILSFIETYSFGGNLKIVHLDEADGLTPQAQDSLRGIMDKYGSTARFILTANNAHKISKPLQSRCTQLNVKPPLAKVMRRIGVILKKESITTTQEEVDKLKLHVKSLYPDFRQIINDSQLFSISGELVVESIDDDKSFVSLLFDSIRTMKPDEVRELWIKQESRFGNSYTHLLKSLHEHVYKSKDVSPTDKGNILLDLTESINYSNMVFDQEINFYNAVLKIQKYLNVF